MRLFLLFSLFSLVSGPGLNGLCAQAGDSAVYRQYEKENMSLYRERHTFEMPATYESQGATVTHVVRSGGSDTTYATYENPPGVDRLLRIHRPGGDVEIEGFRVQIYAGTGYQTAKKLKAEFILAFPEMDVYDTWISPHFRVRCGDFLSRNDALNFAFRIKDKFPGAFVVPDKVKVKKNFKQEFEDAPPPPPEE